MATRIEAATKRSGTPFTLHRGSSMENVFGVNHGHDRLSAFDETEEMDEADVSVSKPKREITVSADPPAGKVEKQQSETSKSQGSGLKTPGEETKTPVNVSAQQTGNREMSALTVSPDSRTYINNPEHKPTAQSGLNENNQENNQKPSETKTESGSLKNPASVDLANQVKTSEAPVAQSEGTSQNVEIHNENSAEETVDHKITSLEGAAHGKNGSQSAASNNKSNTSEETVVHSTSEETVSHQKSTLEDTATHRKNTPEETAAHEKHTSADTRQDDTPSTDNSAQVKRPGSTGKTNTMKQDKRDNTDQKTVRRKSSATSRAARVSRISIDRGQKPDDKADKNDEKVNKNNKPPHTSPHTTNSKTKKPEVEGKSQPTTEKTTESHSQSGGVEAHSQKDSNVTNKPASATKPSRQDAGTKTANGALPNDAKTKRTKPDTKTKREEVDQQKKAHALLSRAVMRRVASMENSKPTDKAPPPQPAANDLNSSAGSKSLGGRSNTSIPHLAHKTQSIQSLAVPGPGVGGSGLTDEDMVSLGSRRDSVSRKSVDYRLQASQAVVTAGSSGGEEKGKSVLMHDDSMIRAAIPALPVPMAVICLMLNILLPGSGTMVSGLAMPCCGKSRLSSKGEGAAVTVCVNLCVGAAQLGTVTFFLVGWFWAMAWGVKMIILAVERREEQRQQREKELQALALRAFGSPGNVGRSILSPV
ncbi:hypothetical protein ACOMHN_059204 [Nucella lapillus]